MGPLHTQALLSLTLSPGNNRSLQKALVYSQVTIHLYTYLQRKHNQLIPGLYQFIQVALGSLPRSCKWLNT